MARYEPHGGISDDDVDLKMDRLFREIDTLAAENSNLKSKLAKLEAEFRAAGTDVDQKAEYRAIVEDALAAMSGDKGPYSKRTAIEHALDRGYNLGVRVKDRELRVGWENLAAAQKAHATIEAKLTDDLKNANQAINQMRETNERLTRENKTITALSAKSEDLLTKPLRDELTREKAKLAEMAKKISMLEGKAVSDWDSNAKFLSSLIEDLLTGLSKQHNASYGHGVMANAKFTSELSTRLSAFAGVLRLKADFIEETCVKILSGEVYPPVVAPAPGPTAPDSDEYAERMKSLARGLFLEYKRKGVPGFPQTHTPDRIVWDNQNKKAALFYGQTPLTWFSENQLLQFEAEIPF